MKNLRLNIIKIVSVLCLISILFSSCAPYVNRMEEAKIIPSEYAGKNYHTGKEASYSPVSKSGLIELLFDKETATVAIRDTNSGTLWTTLPDASISKEVSS